jgi:hypothetical protein
MIGYELTPAGASYSCAPASWRYTGIPLTEADPASNLLPPGTDTVLFSVRTPVPAACRYSIGQPLDYGRMTPFEEGQGETLHRARLRLSPDPRQLNRVFVRSSVAPGYLLELKWRSIAAANPPFPRKGAIWMGSGTLQANRAIASRISLFYGVQFEPREIWTLRAANPDVLIFPAVSADESSDDYASAFGIPADYFLKDVNGKTIEGGWSRLYKLNLTRPEVADFLAGLAYRLIREADFAYDGIFIDNFHTTMSFQSRSDAYGNPVKIDANGDGIEDDPTWLDAAWKDGVYRLLRRFRSLMPNALITGHIWNTPTDQEARASINGDSIVAAATDVAEGRAQLGGLWARYQGWLESARRPALDLIEGAPHHQLAYGYGIWDASKNIPPATLEFARTFYPLVRFGLALTLMGDGYFVFNYGDVGTLLNDLKAVWWYDEYDFDLGYPTGPARLLDTTVGNNLIRNGGFEHPWQEKWNFFADPIEGASATVENTGTAAADGSAAHVSIASAGKPYHVQFWQPGLSLLKEETYTVRFRARADAVRTIGVGVLKDTPDFRSYGLSNAFEAGVDWREYVMTFDSNVTARDARLCFYLGDRVGEVWLDDIVLQAGGEPVYRRDFTNGIVLLNGSDKPARVDLEPGLARFAGRQAPRFQYLVDDTVPGFVVVGNWRVAAVDSGFGPGGGPKPIGPYFHSWNGSCRISDSGAGRAEWPLSIPEDGEYTIQAWWAAAPDASRWCSRAVFDVISSGKVIASAALDERSAGDQWHTIAKVRLSAAGAPLVRLHSEGKGALVADALYVFSSRRLNDGSPVSSMTIGPKDGILLRRVR